MPGRKAIIASNEGLIKIERAIKAGWIGMNSRAVDGENHRD
jgi:hypothetical protein